MNLTCKKTTVLYLNAKETKMVQFIFRTFSEVEIKDPHDTVGVAAKFAEKMADELQKAQEAAE